MKKNILIIFLLIAIISLTGCMSPKTQDIDIATKPEDVTGQNILNVGASNQQPIDSLTDEDLDRLARSEENKDIPEEMQQDTLEQNETISLIRPEESAYKFTGATPIVLNPINMPTPTQAPDLSFSYQAYSLSSLGLTFEGPTGWLIEEEQNFVTLTDPSLHGNFNAYLTITRETLQEELKRSDLQKRVRSEMQAMGPRDFNNNFKPTDVADRTLFGEEGVYSDYRGVLPDGTVVRGRYHVAAIKKVLYVIHQRHSADYNSSFLNIHRRLRDTITVSP